MGIGPARSILAAVLHVLILDDDKKVRAVLRDCLESAGCSPGTESVRIQKAHKNLSIKFYSSATRSRIAQILSIHPSCSGFIKHDLIMVTLS